MKICDLHCHSNCSDGTMTPAELICHAEQCGVAALALTDHNTAKGLPAFLKAAESSTVEAVAGCEFSTDHEGKELHIVGLFMPPSSFAEIEDYVALMHIAKRHSNQKLIRRLNEAGYPITYEEVAASTEADEFNRSHVADVMVKKGYVPDKKTAFAGILKEGNGFYEPPRRLGALATIRFIKEFGGVAVHAHPLYSVDVDFMLRFLPEAKAAGLDAIETLYSEYTAEQTAQAQALAAQFGLRQSGGSDFHGAAKPGLFMGTGRGNLAVPYAFYENLKPKG
ncbi:MAG: PHP domain-containing protein [Eubacterium sp.]|nr:PHP domain-containing protein [Eubacterium sp.]